MGPNQTSELLSKFYCHYSHSGRAQDELKCSTVSHQHSHFVFVIRWNSQWDEHRSMESFHYWPRLGDISKDVCNRELCHARRHFITVRGVFTATKRNVILVWRLWRIWEKKTVNLFYCIRLLFVFGLFAFLFWASIQIKIPTYAREGDRGMNEWGSWMERKFCFGERFWASTSSCGEPLSLSPPLCQNGFSSDRSPINGAAHSSGWSFIKNGDC